MRIVSIALLVLFCLNGCVGDLFGVHASRRQAHFEVHPEIDPVKRQAITEGKIQIGFSAADVRASWGAPSKINRSVGEYGVHEQWVYRYPSDVYVYIEDGVVTGWQD